MLYVYCIYVYVIVNYIIMSFLLDFECCIDDKYNMYVMSISVIYILCILYMYGI